LESNSTNRNWQGCFESTSMHWVSFMLLVAAGVGLYWSPIGSLYRLFNKSELYSHIALIPFVSGYFLYVDRSRIFAHQGWDYRKGMVLLGVAVLIRWFAPSCLPNPNPNDCLSLHMLGFVFWVHGCFLSSYGVSAVRKALFPLIFLVFLIPIPTFMLNPLVQFLQRGSAEAANLIFKVIGVPVYRDGFIFSLPDFTIEVAEQCSGIRASVALFITAIMAGKLFLDKGSNRGILALSIFPISMVKNAMRIVTLAVLASYVDPKFITDSWLHKSGGIPFFGIALLFLLPVLWGLRKREAKDHGKEAHSNKAHSEEVGRLGGREARRR
jgi:exosortase